MTGQRVGRWVVLERGENDQHGHPRWICRCACGTVRLVCGSSLRSGQSRSCGCLRREVASAARTSHGHTRGGRQTAEFRAWRSMLQRCRPRHRQHRDYADRGITVCARWRASFSAFFDDMGPKPSPDLSLDRKDNDGNYEPGNCRWATATQQQNNRRPRRPAPPIDAPEGP